MIHVFHFSSIAWYDNLQLFAEVEVEIPHFY